MTWMSAHAYVLAAVMLLISIFVVVYYVQPSPAHDGVLLQLKDLKPQTSRPSTTEKQPTSRHDDTSTDDGEQSMEIAKNDAVVSLPPEMPVYPTKPPISVVSSSTPVLRRPRVMCMVFTMPSNWVSKATAVRETWAARCHHLAFFYSRNAGYIAEAVALDVPEGRGHLTAKTMMALRWSYARYNASVDWFLKADDDTYIIFENLRALLAQHDPSKPHYIGGRSMDILRTGYNGGGAGYSLSRQAARLVVEQGRSVRCRQDGAIEDLDMGDCLARFRVFPINTLDSQGLLVFHPDHPLKILQGDRSAVSVYTYTAGNHTFGNRNGIGVMSPHMISFHYMDPAHMYMYDFLLYRLIRESEFTEHDDET